MPESKLQQEIGKKQPFALIEEEAFLNVIRTSSLLLSEFEQLFRERGISEANYNVLRILRGAGEPGRMCHEIAGNMVTRVPDVTRLVDRLEKLGLAARARCHKDRRVVFVKITPAGRALVDELDEPVARLHRQQLSHLAPAELRTLCGLLERARERVPASKPTHQDREGDQA